MFYLERVSKTVSQLLAQGQSDGAVIIARRKQRPGEAVMGGNEVDHEFRVRPPCRMPLYESRGERLMPPVPGHPPPGHARGGTLPGHSDPSPTSRAPPRWPRSALDRRDGA